MTTLNCEPPSSSNELPVNENSDPCPLNDIADYTEGIELPLVDWVTPLNLDSPRKNIHCLRKRTRLVKRVGDILCAIFLLILCSPVMILTAILVKLTSPGPAIFSQVRVGLNLRRPKNDRRQNHAGVPEEVDECRRKSDRRETVNYGREFTLYKFRTMRNDAEKNGAQFAVKGDVRITSIGKFLRKTRIDELPQLWNVIRGDMSMVGPRPERPEFIEELSDQIPDYLNRLGLKPGLTGVAQIVNGYDNNIESFKRKVAFDLLYLQCCCAWNDFKILLRTIRVVLTGSGAL